MSAAEHVEGEVIEHDGNVAHPPAVIPPEPARLDVVPTIAAGDLIKRLDVIREAQEKAMDKGTDYGVIPGTDKPTLLKPGAEKLGVLFQLDVQLVNQQVWGPGDHLTVTSRATVFHAPTGARLGYGEGVCTTREKKYAYRNAERACPECGKANIRKSKRPGEGFYCWVKTDGCGATFAENDQRITAQTVGQVDNPDLPDLWNTIVKMAEKRARVDAVLAVTGASALFTQDMEDSAPSPEPQANGDPPQSSPPRQEAQATAEPSERHANAGQKRKINAKASERGLSGVDFANCVLVACGQPTRRFDSDAQGLRFAHAQVERLPERLVDAVLAQIAEASRE